MPANSNNLLYKIGKSLYYIDDSFKKIIVVKDDVKPRKDDNGITTIGVFNFLLEENSLNL